MSDTDSDLADRIVVREVTPDFWSDLEALFGAKGGPNSCWCMVWRARGDETKRTDPTSRRQAMQLRVVDEHEPVGLLAYLDGKPVAWCSVAPRSTFRRLGGTDYDDIDESRIWSIVCFFIHRSVRGYRLTDRLLDEAIRHTQDNGAAVVEAYPVDPDSPSYRFMGFVSTFEKAGFRHQHRAGKRRHVMALHLSN